VRGLDGSQEVLSSIVDTGNKSSIAFCDGDPAKSEKPEIYVESLTSVGSPQNDDLIQIIVLLEITNVLSDFIEMSLLV